MDAIAKDCCCDLATTGFEQRIGRIEKTATLLFRHRFEQIGCRITRNTLARKDRNQQDFGVGTLDPDRLDKIFDSVAYHVRGKSLGKPVIGANQQNNECWLAGQLLSLGNPPKDMLDPVAGDALVFRF